MVETSAAFTGLLRSTHPTVGQMQHVFKMNCHWATSNDLETNWRCAWGHFEIENAQVLAGNETHMF